MREEEKDIDSEWDMIGRVYVVYRVFARNNDVIEWGIDEDMVG